MKGSGFGENEGVEQAEKLRMRNVSFWVKSSLVPSLDVVLTVVPQICEIWALFPPIAVLKQQAYPEGLLLFSSRDSPNQTVWVTAGLSLFTMTGSFVWTVFGICDCGPIDTRLQPTREWRCCKKPLPALTGRDQQTISYSVQMLIYTRRCECYNQASASHLYWISTIHWGTKWGYCYCYRSWKEASYCGSKRRAVRLKWQPAGRVLH